jgi:hypothetical protein
MQAPKNLLARILYASGTKMIFRFSCRTYLLNDSYFCWVWLSKENVYTTICCWKEKKLYYESVHVIFYIVLLLWSEISVGDLVQNYRQLFPIRGNNKSEFNLWMTERLDYVHSLAVVQAKNRTENVHNLACSIGSSDYQNDYLIHPTEN